MIQKLTILLTTDKSGLNLIKTFHLYSGFNRHWTSIGRFVKGSAKVAVNKKFKNMDIFRKIKKVRKGQIIRALITRQCYKMVRPDISNLKVKDNTCIALRKRKLLRSKYIFGPIFLNFKRKRFFYLYKTKINMLIIYNINYKNNLLKINKIYSLFFIYFWKFNFFYVYCDFKNHYYKKFVKNLEFKLYFKSTNKLNKYNLIIKTSNSITTYNYKIVNVKSIFKLLIIFSNLNYNKFFFFLFFFTKLMFEQFNTNLNLYLLIKTKKNLLL